MKKRYFIIGLTALFAINISAQLKLDFAAADLYRAYKSALNGEQVLNPDLRLVTNSNLMESRAEKQQFVDPGCGDNMVGAIVNISKGYNSETINLEGLGTITSEISDNLAIISVPIKNLELLSELPGVDFVSVGDLKKPAMHVARQTTGINSIHNGENLEQAYKGKGVVIGIFDTGIDPNHINFRTGDNYSVRRVKEAYAFTNSNGVPTKSATTPQEVAQFTTDLTTQTHGTHCIGIAAGSYNGTGEYMNGTTKTKTDNMPLYGNAPESDIIMGGGKLYDSNIVAGVTKCIEYAEANNKPVVINLSLGSIMGQRDGNSAFSQALANLGKRGIICVAAGNDAGTKHCCTFSGNGRTASARRNTVGIVCPTSQPEEVMNIQIYSNRETAFSTAEFILFDLTTKKIVYSQDLTSGSVSTSKNDVFASAFSSGSYLNFFSGKTNTSNQFYYQIQGKIWGNYNYLPAIRIARDKDDEAFLVADDLTFTNFSDRNNDSALAGYTDNNGDGWNTWSDGTDDGTISAMATGENIIVVGAYTSSSTAPLLGGGAYGGSEKTGKICSFSSYGRIFPSDERVPHVCAPGSMIVSSVNTYNSPTYNSSCGYAQHESNGYYWGPMQGTSMATPFITGTIALWLEADPNLTANDIKAILKKTSSLGSGQTSRMASDGGDDLNHQWGGGKIEAVDGLKEVIENKAAINSVFDDDSKRLIITQNDNELNVYVAGETNLTATLYSTLGAQVAKAHAADQELTLSTAGLQKGVYILNANGVTGRYSKKILVK